MRRLCWFGLSILLWVACTVQESIVVERSTAVPSTAAPTLLPVVTEEVVIETAVPSTTSTSLPVAVAVETDEPVVTATPQPIPTATLFPPATSTPTKFLPSFSHLEFREQIGGHVQAVEVADEFVYIGVGPRLIVLGVNDPATPQKVGQSEVLSGIVQDIVLHEGMAYVATDEMGIWQIDVSQPQQPVIVQFIATSQLVNRLQANQTFLLAVNRNRDASFAEQAQVSVINLVEGKEIGRLTMPGPIIHYTVAEDNLFTIIQYDSESPNERTYEFIRWDITDPLQSVPMAVLPLSRNSYSKRIFINGSLAYVIGLGELSIIDISNPNELIEIFYNPSMMSPQIGVGGLVFLPDSQLLIVDSACDVGCSARLQITNGTNSTLGSGVGYIAYEMAANESHAFIATGDALVVVSLEQSGNPDVIGRYYETGILGNIIFTNGYFYFIGWTQNFLNIMPLDDLKDSYSYNRVDVIGVPDEIAIEGNFLFLSNHGGLVYDDIRILDINNPKKAEQIAAIRGERLFPVMQTTISNGIVYTLLDREFAVFDVRDINNAEQIGHYNQTEINYFVLRDNWVYADSAILDISDLMNPQAVDQLPQISGHIIEMIVVDNRLYILTTADQQPTILYTLDLNQPASPQIIHEQEVDNSITSLAIYNNLLVGLGDDVWAFDISQTEEPILVDRFLTAGLAKDAVVANGRLYVADDAGGILVFEGVP